MACAAGTWSDDGWLSCRPCAAGSWSALNGQSSCSPCAAGTWSDEGQSSCTPLSLCPPGYQCSGGTRSPCAAGSWSDEGQSSCSPCAAGSWSDEGQSSCSLFPDGRNAACCLDNVCYDSGVSYYGETGCGAGQYQVSQSTCPNGDPSETCSKCADCPPGRSKYEPPGCSKSGLNACLPCVDCDFGNGEVFDGTKCVDLDLNYLIAGGRVDILDLDALIDTCGQLHRNKDGLCDDVLTLTGTSG
jgi:hypothetical protein